VLTQDEADALIAMRKRFVNPIVISIPAGTDQTHELIGDDNREPFLLDLWRGTIRLSKVKYQTRGRKVIVLVRVEVDGAPHTNPDGKMIACPHIHLYREGYEDRWAFSIDQNEFTDPNDIGQTFNDFCRYCNVNPIPRFQEALV